MERTTDAWEHESKALANEMEKYAKNYKCKKCMVFYCIHMRRARGEKFKNKINVMLNGLISLKTNAPKRLAS